MSLHVVLYWRRLGKQVGKKGEMESGANLSVPYQLSALWSLGGKGI